MKKYFLSIFIVSFSIIWGCSQSTSSTLNFDLEKIVEEKYDQYPAEILLDSKGRMIFIGAELSLERSANGYNSWETIIWRRLPDGELDKDFGEQGKLIYRDSYKGNETHVAVIQSDDKIVICETVRQKSTDSLRMTRLLPDGKLDKDFGKNGSVLINPNPFESANLHFTDIEIQKDGKILVLGNFAQGKNFDLELFLFRFLKDGTLDKKFGKQGMIKSQGGKFQDRGIKLLVEDNGKIWILGNHHTESIFSKDLQIHVTLTRLNEDGTLDEKFADKGTSIFTGEQQFYYPRSIEKSPNGKLVLSGYVNLKPQQGSHFVMIFDPNEPLDLEIEKNNFSVLETPLGQNFQVSNTSILEDHSILLWGTNHLTGKQELVVTHFTADGKPDLDFCGKGYFIKSLGDLVTLTPNASIQQKDGKVIISGSTRKKVGYFNLFFLSVELK